jgi:pimeloyl-ACP methyl ester carboxylesterase
MKGIFMKAFINTLSVNSFGDLNKQAIIFIHGFPFDHSMWEYLIETLKDDYFCIAYDVRGLGESYVGDGQYTMEFFVDDLFSIINELKLKKPVLCGHSMGGYIGLRAIERSQDKFGGLILCDSKSEADDNAAKLKRTIGINQINTEELQKFTDPFVTNCFADETPAEDEKLFDNTRYKARRHNPTGVKGCLLAIMSRTDTTNFLPQIKIPTLLICGAFDKLTPPFIMRAIADKIPDSEFASIPMAAHMSPLENPECVDDLITGFLKRRIINKK